MEIGVTDMEAIAQKNPSPAPESTCSVFLSEMLKNQQKLSYPGGIIMHVVIVCGKMERLVPMELGGGIPEAKGLEFHGDWESVFKRTVLSPSNGLVLE